jgi:hypothetical protein
MKNNNSCSFTMFQVDLNLYSHASTFLCLSQARTWISNVTYQGLFCVQCDQLWWEVIVRFVDIGRIDDHQLFKLSFHNLILNFFLLCIYAHFTCISIYRHTFYTLRILRFSITFYMYQSIYRHTFYTLTILRFSIIFYTR